MQEIVAYNKNEGRIVRIKLSSAENLITNSFQDVRFSEHN